MWVVYLFLTVIFGLLALITGAPLLMEGLMEAPWWLFLLSFFAAPFFFWRMGEAIGQDTKQQSTYHDPIPPAPIHARLIPTPLDHKPVPPWHDSHYSSAVPTPSQPLTMLEQLTRLRDSCLSLLDKTPLKDIPLIVTRPKSYFLELAHAQYESIGNLICFNESYLETATPEQLVNTMKHELAHAWLHQHGYDQENWHGPHFQIVAKLLGIEVWQTT